MNVNIIEIDELKSLLKLQDDEQDDILAIMIQSAGDYARTQCVFNEGDLFPDGMKIFAYKFIQYYMQSDNTLLSSYKEGNVQFNYANELPVSIQSLLNPYILVRFSYER